MKLLIVRHGDPDYSIDSLTETGWIEAELLSDRLCKLDVKAFYCSPKGRARDTAKATLEKLGRQASSSSSPSHTHWASSRTPAAVKRSFSHQCSRS